MAPLGFAYFVWSEIRERRRARDEDALIAEATATAIGTGADETAPSESESSQSPAQKQDEPDTTVPSTEAAPPSSRRTRSRYGGSKPDFYEKIRERGHERF